MMTINTLSPGLSQRPKQIVSLLLALGLSACSQSYVVLLAEDNGKLGKIEVTTPQGITVVENDRSAVNMEGAAGKTFPVEEEQIQADFGSALSTSPKLPQSFYLYFEGGGATLTAESMQTIPAVIDEIKRRTAVDISVIGHSDTVGDDQTNTRLSMERAQSIATLFTEAIPDASKITVDSHGEKNLVVPTPDNTDEPKNRCVEVYVR